MLFADTNKFRAVEVFISGCLFGAVSGTIILSWLYKYSVPGAIIVYVYGTLTIGLAILFVWWLVKRRIFMPLAFCTGWLLLETFFMFCNVHWVLLGYAWTHCEPLIQIADITGVYGISALILLLNASIANLIIASKLLSHQTFRFQMQAIVTFAITLILITCTFIYGKTRIAKLSHEKPEKLLNILGIQVNVANKDLSVSNHVVKTMKKISDLINHAEAVNFYNSNKIDLIVLPERALPGVCFTSDDLACQVGVLAYELEIPVMTGVLRKIIRKDKEIAFNSAIIAYPDVEMSEVYNKQGLIPLAENTRFKKHFKKLPFLKKMIKRNVTPGRHFSVFSVKNSLEKTIKIGPLICYEDTLSRIACGMAKRGAEIFINLTNDGGFPNPKAAWQHQNISRLRTIESRLPLFRVTNTGVTCFINRCGEVKKIMSTKGKSTFVEGFLKVKADIFKPKQTFYLRYGNLFLYSNLFVSIGCVIFGVFKS